MSDTTYPYIPAWKARCLLDQRGLTPKVQASIKKLPNAAIVTWAFNEADTFMRHNAALIAVLTDMGYDSAGIDQLFVDGNAITC